MIREHRRAVLDRLARWRVVDDREWVDDVSWPAPWVVVDFPPPLMVTDRWEADDRHRGAGWFQAACVGESVDQAGALHDEVVDLLLNWVPAVPGWSVFPVLMDTDPLLLDWAKLPDRRLVQVVTRWTWQAYRR